MAVLGHGADLDHAAPQVAGQQLEPARGAERRIGGAQHGQVAGDFGLVPDEMAVFHGGNARKFLQALGPHGEHIAMHEAGLQQLADHVAWPACGLELVHVGAAVGIDAGQQRHHAREFRKIIPVDDDACRTRHGHPMDQVVGRSARGQQGHHGVDDAALVHHMANGCEAAVLGDGQHAAHGPAREQFAFAVGRVDEGRARHVQAHGLQQHLVAVGRAVEGAGAFAVVGSRFGGQQFLAAHQALRGLFAHLGLVAIGQARGHGAGRHEHRGQMAEMQGPDQQAWHDLVANAQHQRGVEHVMRQRDGRAHGNGIPAEQAQFHAWRALGHAVAHGRHAAGDLRRGAELARLVLEDVGIACQRRMGREHVVVRGDDGDVGRLLFHDAYAVAAWNARKGMGHIGTAHGLGAGRARGHGVHLLQVGGA